MVYYFMQFSKQSFPYSSFSDEEKSVKVTVLLKVPQEVKRSGIRTQIRVTPKMNDTLHSATWAVWPMVKSNTYSERYVSILKSSNYQEL